MLNLRKLLMAGAAALMLAAPAYAPAGLALMPLAARAQEADENYTCAQLNDTVARLGEQAVVAIYAAAGDLQRQIRDGFQKEGFFDMAVVNSIRYNQQKIGEYTVKYCAQEPELQVKDAVLAAATLDGITQICIREHRLDVNGGYVDGTGYHTCVPQWQDK